MIDGYIKKGPIIDYEGSNHLSTKTFFLKHPLYAMMVVLRTINELMAGKVENLPQIYEVFQNPNWSEIVKEIVKLVFYKPEFGELITIEPNILEIYNLDSKKIIPSDEEIQEVQNLIKKL